MAVYFTEEWLKNYCQRTGQKVPTHTNPSRDREHGSTFVDVDERGHTMQSDTPAGAKYHNKPTEYRGKRFASIHEAQIYEMLRLECLAGKHMGLACQVAFYLPGGVKYVADFVTLEDDGTYTVYDAKSEATRQDKTYRVKKRQMKTCLGIEIQEV